MVIKSLTNTIFCTIELKQQYYVECFGAILMRWTYSRSKLHVDFLFMVRINDLFT